VINPSIRQAILHQRLLAVDDGHTSRVVEPYAYAVERDGSEILWCFQISGGSASGNPIGWKLLRVRKLHGLRPLRQTFRRTRDGWQRYRERALEQIYCECEVDDVGGRNAVRAGRGIAATPK
jgi:hypothetical protein